MRRFTSVVLGAILSLVLVTSAQAQAAIGLRAGYNSSKISVTEDGASIDDGFDSRGAFFAGVDLAIGLSPMFGIQAGAAYSQKGASASEGDASLTLAVDYVDVPLLLVVSIPTSGSITPRLFAGGVASFEMSCKLKGTLGEQSQSADCGDDDIGARKKSYFSAMFGGGIGFAAGPGSLILDVDYQLGLTNISDVEGTTVKMNVIQASLGYQFPLGG